MVLESTIYGACYIYGINVLALCEELKALITQSTRQKAEITKLWDTKQSINSVEWIPFSQA